MPASGTRIRVEGNLGWWLTLARRVADRAPRLIAHTAIIARSASCRASLTATSRSTRASTSPSS